MKNPVDEIINSLENDDWYEGSMNLTFCKSGSNLEMWIMWAPLGISLYRPEPLKVSFAEKFKLWSAIKRCKKRMILKALEVKK